MPDVKQRLNRRINIGEVCDIVARTSDSVRDLELLFDLAKSGNDIIGRNALWCLTHCIKAHGAWLQSKQDELIDMLLSEEQLGRRRMLLGILRYQSYDKDCMRTDFLDYCLSRINAECEPYAIRCYSIYCAFKMCRLYPELIAELEEHLAMLDYQPLGAGLRSAAATTRRMIGRLKATRM